MFFESEHSATRACDVQSWETKDCKAEAATAVQSWETNVKDCKAEADTAVQSWEEEETNKRKWETSQPGTRPEAPSLGDK